MENGATSGSSVPPEAGIKNPSAEVRSRSGREVDISTRREIFTKAGLPHRVRDVDVGAGASAGCRQGMGTGVEMCEECRFTTRGVRDRCHTATALYSRDSL